MTQSTTTLITHVEQADLVAQVVTNCPVELVRPLPYPLARRANNGATVSIVVPVFNEEAVLDQTYAGIRDALDELGIAWSVLFINDGSRDSTATILERLHRADTRVGLINLSRNFGHQAALSAGLDHADGDVVITMDGDLQHPPALISTMLDAWHDGFDVVHTRKVETVGLSRRRSIATRIAYSLVQRVSQIRIIPQASDFRLLDRQVLDALRSLPEHSRLYRGLTPWVGFRQGVLPYEAAERAAGTSQYGLRQLLSLFTRAVFDFSDIPLHVGLALGGIAVGLSCLYLLFILAWLVFGQHTPPGWASSMSITLLLNSVTLAFLGIIGVYVARIYNEIRARPTYVISLVRRGVPK